MEDGSYHKRDKIYTLHVGGFTLSKCEMISKEIYEKYKLNSSVRVDRINKSKVSYKIVFMTKDTNKIQNIIKRYMIEMFSYKL